MAELEFRFFDVEGRETKADNVLSFELSRDISAPCDGLRFSFLTDSPLDEIKEVKAYLDGELIFNGLCDTQQEKALAEGFEAFIYARSNACILVDNDAHAYTYESPSARGLFIMNAKQFGFKFALEDCSCKGSYTVGRGVSCYGAINELVSMIKKRNLVVTPENELTVPSGDGRVRLSGDKIISEKRIINRGCALSEIDYKTASGSDYSYHFKSRSLERAGIERSRKLNLSALPDWQRSYVLNNAMARAAYDYQGIELITSELLNVNLYSGVELNESAFEGIGDYCVKSVDYVFDKRGERMILSLFKEYDLEEIIYVD